MKSSSKLPNQIQKIAAYARATDEEIAKTLTRHKYNLSRSAITRYRNEIIPIPSRLSRFIDYYFTLLIIDILKKRKIHLERKIKKLDYPKGSKWKLEEIRRLAKKYGIVNDVF